MRNQVLITSFVIAVGSSLTAADTITLHLAQAGKLTHS
jgi:hypothetical protein